MTNEDLARALNHLFPEGGVVIHADGTFEVPGTIPTEDERQQALIESVKQDIAKGIREEVARRILSCASTATQMNLAAAAAGGMLSEDQMTAYRAGLAWIAQIRATGASLVAAGDPDFADDAKWPTIPTSAAELAAQF